MVRWASGFEYACHMGWGYGFIDWAFGVVGGYNGGDQEGAECDGS